MKTNNAKFIKIIKLIVFASLLIFSNIATYQIANTSNDQINDTNENIENIDNDVKETPLLSDYYEKGRNVINQTATTIKDTFGILEGGTTSVQEDTWYQGESVRTEVEFTNGFPYLEDHRRQCYSFTDAGTTWVYTIKNYENMFQDTDSINSLSCEISSGSEKAVSELIFRIYAGHTGTLRYKFTAFLSSSIHTVSFDSTFTVTQDHIDRDGYIFLKLESRPTHDGLGYNNHLHMFRILNANTGAFVNIATDTKAVGSNVWSLMAYEIRRLFFIPDNIISYPRIKYQYTDSSTIIGKLNVHSVDHNTKITVYKPTDFEFTSISPSATTSMVSGNLFITGTVNTIYEIRFVKHKQQLFAVNDVTNDVSKCMNYECGNVEHWVKRTGGGSMATSEIATNIVFNGAFSHKIADTKSGTSQISLSTDFLELGFFYIVFSFYVESYQSGEALRLFSAGSGYPLTTYDLDDYSSNRWHTVIIALSIKEKTQYSGMPEPSYLMVQIVNQVSGTTIIYLDNFQFFQTNLDIETVGLKQHEASLNLRNIDNRHNPLAINTKVYVEAFDSTSFDSELLTSGVTDSTGSFKFDILGEFEAKEYLFYIGNYENHNHVEADTIRNDLKVWYQFENNILDSSINDLDASGTLSYRKGKINRGGDFDGASNQITRETELFRANDISFSMWVYHDTLGTSNKGFFSIMTNGETTSDDGFWFHVNTNNILWRTKDQTNGQNNWQDDFETVANTWYHYFLIFEFNKQTIYRNNELLAEYTKSFNMTDLRAGFDLRILLGNTFTSTTSHYHDGMIDDFRGYLKVLSEKERNEIYYNSPQFKEFIPTTVNENSNIYEGDNYVVAYSDTNDVVYATYSNNIFTGYYQDLEVYILNLAIGNHNVTFLPLYRQNLLYPTIANYTGKLEYLYSVVESDLSTITIVDQQNNYIDVRSLKVFVNGARIQGDTFLWIDKTSSKNLTITDIFDNIVFQNLSLSYQRFFDLVLNLRSTKIVNMQNNPIYLFITLGDRVYSEWVLPNEIVHYRLFSGSYNFTILYSTVGSGFSSATTNGTSVTFIYDIQTDTALVITGKTVQDVFNNVMSLSSDLNSVNATLHTQIFNVRLDVSNVNTTIGNQLVNVEINLSNVNSSLGNQLIDIFNNIANVESNITMQLIDIDTLITNVNSSIFLQTLEVLSSISNVNSTIFAQTISIMSAINNLDSDLALQTVTMLNEFNNINSNITSQTIDILNYISNVNSTLFEQTVTMLNELNNIDSAIALQTINILNSISNVNSTLFEQTIGIISAVSNVESEIGVQTVNILNSISNVNSTLFVQTVSMLNSISNVNSTLYSQSVALMSQIINVNSTLYEQTLELLLQIDLSNSTQVSLLLSNQEQILLAQQFAKEYMSVLRLEQLNPVFNPPHYSFFPITNWGNASVSIYLNSTSVFNGTENQVIALELTNYGFYNITIMVQGENPFFIYTFTQSYFVNFVAPPIGHEIILIYVYDLEGQRLHLPPWDLYYDSKILDSYAIQIEINTFDPDLVTFRDLYSNNYPGILMNITESISGYKVYQFQLNAYQVSLFNEQLDAAAELSLKQLDTWRNFTLSPGESRIIWIANITTDFFAHRINLEDIGSISASKQVIGNITKPVSQSISFGLSQNVKALMNGDDVSITNYQLQEQKKNFALFYQGSFAGVPIDIQLTWSQLWYILLFGIFTMVFAIVRFYLIKHLEVRTEDQYDYQKGKYVKKKKIVKKEDSKLEIPWSLLFALMIIIILFFFTTIVNIFAI
jgi:hypothetical protein